MKKIILILLFAAAFAVRLYKISSPVADWHSWRQADTIAVSRNFVKYGIDLLKPQYDDLSNVASGRENPQGLRMVEFPIYNAVVAVVYKTIPSFRLEVWGRLVTIFSSILTMLFIYLLVKKYVNDWAGIFAAFFFGFLPFSVFYGRVLLPEPTMMMFAFASLWFISCFTENKKMLHLVAATIFFAIALLIKPTAVFFGLPIMYLLIIINVVTGHCPVTTKKILYIAVFLLSFLPFLLWRFYIQQFPEGIPASSWLLNGDGIRFKGAWFRWIFGERVSRLILGYWGVAFLTLGIFWQKIKKNLVFEMLGLSSFVYLAVFATGNVRHDYYQILILPTVAIYCGIGLQMMLSFSTGVETRNHWNFWLNLTMIFFIIFLNFALSWYEVQGYFNINHPEIVDAGRKVDQIVPRDAKIIAPYGGDTAFLYQTNRAGWPLFYNTQDVAPQIMLGATHYVSVNFDEPTKRIMEKCRVMYQNEQFVIVELKCKK